MYCCTISLFLFIFLRSFVQTYPFLNRDYRDRGIRKDGWMVGFGSGNGIGLDGWGEQSVGIP